MSQARVYLSLKPNEFHQKFSRKNTATNKKRRHSLGVQAPADRKSSHDFQVHAERVHAQYIQQSFNYRCISLNLRKYVHHK